MCELVGQHWYFLVRVKSHFNGDKTNLKTILVIPAGDVYLLCLNWNPSSECTEGNHTLIAHELKGTSTLLEESGWLLKEPLDFEVDGLFTWSWCTW